VSTYEIKDDKFLILNVGDNYEHLTEKTICLFRTVLLMNPTIKGIFKCDDDIIPNKMYLNNIIERLNNEDIAYMGASVNYQKHMSKWHYGKCSSTEFNTPKLIPKCCYATGPIYYLNLKSIQILINNPLKTCFAEDATVGFNLNNYNIIPLNVPLYQNNFNQIFKYNIQNIDNKIKTLMVRLHGGLGNQLFQAAAGYYLAKKYSFSLVLAYPQNRIHTHGEEFSNTVFRRFNVILNDDVSYFDNVVRLNEPNNNKTCFEYHGDNIIRKYENHFLTGYFINKEYINKIGKEFVELLRNDEIYDSLLQLYPNAKTSYFIHIRRGDYVGNELYVFDYDTYLKKALTYIFSLDKNAHFFILSDDIPYCKTYDLLNNLNKTFIEMDTLHSIYLMSLCKGGICSNSTFSGWGTILNANTYENKKTAIFPKKWINTPHKVNIPFNYTITF
jgi:ribosomal protein S27AE